MTRLLLVTPNFENNSLGRTWCLWRLAEELGWDVEVRGVTGATVWSPLAGTRFAGACRLPGPDALGGLRDAAHAADLVVAVKPLPTSLGVALDTGAPVLADIDDPDVEVRTSWRPLVERLRRPGFLPRQRALVALGEAARTVPRIVSNPVLQRMYGGDVVPHVRDAGPGPVWSDRTEPVVRFVGSVRGHKGVDVLRAAARCVARLEVTAPAPADAAPGEGWLGLTSVEDGAALVRSADVIAVPSLPTLWSPAQLPAKLIDAMIAGRAVVASATEPVVWALGDAGITVPPGDEGALRAALVRFRDPDLRRTLGAAAREAALARFSVEAVAPSFESAAHRAMTAVPA